MFENGSLNKVLSALSNSQNIEGSVPVLQTIGILATATCNQTLYF